MKQTTFTFTVEFKSAEPFASHDALLQILREVKNVSTVESQDGHMTPRCPVAKISVEIAFETAKQALRLYHKLTKIIDAHPQTSRWSRACILTDIHGST